MYYRLFVLIFCVNVICASVRVENLIKVLRNDLKHYNNRPDPPSYLNTKADCTNVLTTYHLVSEKQLKLVYTTLLDNAPQALIQILRSIYYNLPCAWRNENKNQEFFEATQCLDDTIADEDLVNIERCKESVQLLYTLFYWRPDNIQIGPTNRCRNFGDDYDYDYGSFYFLTGVEMIYSSEFRLAVEAVLNNRVPSEEHVNRLVCASHNMISNRNVPRKYNPSEWQ
uniref:Maco-A 61 n=1 Tax=Mamestra configurata nucleopolyhedrovirus TaxID=207830 RepID=A0A7G7Y845_NPVMC|nr:maco-A 61 [Mamestra configurata nucleopolyhedrovirus A]